MGGPIIRMIILWHLYWGPPILGNYHMKTAWRFRINVTHVYLMPITPSITLVSDLGAYKLECIWVIGTSTSGLQLTLNLQAVSLKGCSVVYMIIRDE